MAYIEIGAFIKGIGPVYFYWASNSRATLS